MRRSANSLQVTQHTATFVCLFALQFLVIANGDGGRTETETATGIERTVPETTIPPPRWAAHSVDQLSATTVHDRILHRYFREHPDAPAGA